MQLTADNIRTILETIKIAYQLNNHVIVLDIETAKVLRGEVSRCEVFDFKLPRPLFELCEGITSLGQIPIRVSVLEPSEPYTCLGGNIYAITPNKRYGKITIEYKDESGGYLAYRNSAPEMSVVGETRSDALQHLEDAINKYT